MKTLLFSFAFLICALTACAQSNARPVLYNSTTKALIDDLNSGSKTFEVTASGTLKWNSGATLTNASDFRVSAGLGTAAIKDVGSGAGNVPTWPASPIAPTHVVMSVAGSEIQSNTLASASALLAPTMWDELGLTAELDAKLSLDGDLDFSGFSSISGTLPVANGGTGQATVQAAINALMAASGAMSQGDVFYFNGTNVVRLGAGTSGQYLQTQGSGANPQWATISSGITINSTITSGAAANDFLISDGTKVQVKTPGSGVITAFGNATDASGGLLTYGIIGTSGTKIGLLNTANTFSAAQTIASGTITADAPAINITQTWNNSGVEFHGMVIDLTGTAYASPATYHNDWITFKSGGVVQGGIEYSFGGSCAVRCQNVFFGNYYNAINMQSSLGMNFLANNTYVFSLYDDGIRFASTEQLSWTNGSSYSGTRDVGLKRASAGTLQVTDGTTGLGALKTGSLTIGNGGAAISKVLSTTTTWDVANLADGASETKSSITLTGAAVGDIIDAALTTLVDASWDIEAVVTASDTVAVRVTNRTGGAVDLASGTLRVTIIQH